MTGAITWEQVLTLTSIAIAIGGVWYHLAKSITRCREELLEYKAEVAKQYVPYTAMRKTEERLSQDIRQLGERFDKLIDVLHEKK